MPPDLSFSIVIVHNRVFTVACVAGAITRTGASVAKPAVAQGAYVGDAAAAAPAAAQGAVSEGVGIAAGGVASAEAAGGVATAGGRAGSATALCIPSCSSSSFSSSSDSV